MKLIFDKEKFQIVETPSGTGLIITEDNYKELSESWEAELYDLFEFENMSRVLKENDLIFVYYHELDCWDFNKISVEKITPDDTITIINPCYENKIYEMVEILLRMLK